MEQSGTGWRWLWGALIWTVGVGPTVRELLRPALPSSPPSAALVLVAQLLNYLVIALAIGGCLYGATVRRFRLPSKGVGLWLAALLFSGGLVFSSAFAIRPVFPLGIVFVPLMITALFLLPPVSGVWFLKQSKRVLVVLMYGSLIAGLVAPSWAFELGYRGFIPGFDVRLNGVVPWGANLLGPMMVLFLVLEHVIPSEKPWRWITRLSSVLVLVLTQSKTAWVAAIVVWLFWHYEANRGKRVSLLYFGLTFLGAPIVITGTLAAADVWSLASDAWESLSSLTGRTALWPYVTTLWKANPWFGYGPALFADGDLTRVAVLAAGGWSPRHAHNQFMHVFGQAGIVGVLSLFCYTITLFVYAIRSNKVRNLCLAALATLFIHGLTEVPLRNYEVDGELMMHMFVYGLLLLAERDAFSIAKVSGPSPSRF